MAKKKEIEGIVTRVDFPGKGLVEGDDGIKLWVKGVVAGQRVSCRIKKYRNGIGEGNLIQIIERSKSEIAADCPHFGSCGGCIYRNLSYEDQLVMKEEQVRRLLKNVIPEGHNYEWLGIKASPLSSKYRNKMEFTFGDEYMGGELTLGLHKKNSFYDVVYVKDCEIIDEDYRKILNITKDFFCQRRIPYYHRMNHNGYLRHLMVRKAAFTGEIMVVLVTSSDYKGELPEKKLLQEYVDTLIHQDYDGQLVSVIHTVNDSLADTIVSDRNDILYGKDFIKERLLGLEFRISEFSFFQTNSYSAEVLYDCVREFVGNQQGKAVYDLYSGTGTIAQILAPISGHVIGVEIVGEAVEAARENAEINNLDNCEFIQGDVLLALDNIAEKPDFIILDPPREGIHPKALKKIIDYGVEKIIYISCKPTSLARDLEMMQYGGYGVEKVVVVDQFPGTGHVETCVLLSRETYRHPDARVKIDVKLEDYYAIKDSKKE